LWRVAADAPADGPYREPGRGVAAGGSAARGAAAGRVGFGWVWWQQHGSHIWKPLMNANLAAITGIGSVSPYGPLAGLIPQGAVKLEPITTWKTAGLRRAFLVKPFRPADVVPGLNTRRLDRLSAWALVASSLAIQDAGIGLSQVDRSRVAVVFATAFGCVDLTEAFYLSAAANGWNGTDPSTFPGAPPRP